jgi:hypothetical protein
MEVCSMQLAKRSKCGERDEQLKPRDSRRAHKGGKIAFFVAF